MKELIIFLKKHRVLTKYRKNFKDREYTFNFKTFCLTNHLTSYISGAFHWSNTKEGHNFWSNLDDKWRKELL